MRLYLFPQLAEDDLVQTLETFAQAPSEALYFRLFPTLLAFTEQESVTNKPVLEYMLSRLVEQPVLAAYIASEEGQKYLAKDAECLYQLMYTTSWNTLAETLSLLPFPVVGAPGERIFGNAYRSWITAGTELCSGKALAEHILSFFLRYQTGEEAKYIGFAWKEPLGLVGLRHIDPISFQELTGIERKKEALVQNTQAFLAGKPANNVLLVGGSGTGKSSCVKATLNHFKESELKMVELAPNQLGQLPQLMEALRGKKCHYIIFIDDLSFDEADKSYINLKVALDGQLEPKPAQVLIYATSNRRRLMRESWAERQGVEDIHSHDTQHEKTSLSERFGIRLYYGVLSQGEYFSIIQRVLAEYGLPFTDELGVEAATWATTNNGRSGRTAQQFVKFHLARTL